MKYHTTPFKLREFKIEVTYRCDLNCIHCSSDAKPAHHLEISQADCEKIIIDASVIGAKDVAFSGGEPLGWTYIDNAVEMASKQGLNISIYTSGNTADFNDKAERLHRLGASRFIFSLFGSNVTSHERITRKSGSFHKTLDAMRGAIAAGLRTELHFVPMSVNYRELDDIVSLVDSLGVAVISILRLVPQGRASLLSGRALDRIQNLELRNKIIELRKSGYKIRTGSPYNFLMLNDNPGCWAAIDRLIVGPDLRIYPCDAFKRITSEEVVRSGTKSSLKETDLTDCWLHSDYFNAVRNYLTTDFSAPCNSCGSLNRCLSGCLAQKVIKYGNLAKRPDPDCLDNTVQGSTE